MQNSTTKKIKGSHFFFWVLLLVLMAGSSKLLAQKKITATPLVNKGSAALSKAFKKYRLFTVSSPALFAQAKVAGKAPLHVDLEFPGINTFSLSLDEKDLLSSSYKMTVESANGRKVYDRPDIKTYIGKLSNDPSSAVALTVSNNTIYGSIKGAKGKNYFIEPLRYFDKNASPNSFVMYEATDVVPESGVKCAVTEAMERQSSSGLTATQRPLGTATGTCKMVGMAIASDATMFNKYGSAQAVEEHNISVMNTVALLYSNAQIGTSYLQFKINGQYVSTAVGNDPLSPSFTGADPSILLTNFITWGKAGNFGFNYNIGQFWTIRRGTNILGLANVGAVCTDSSYQVIEDFSSSALSIGSTVAHEIAHNFGAVHDNIFGYIMYPTVTEPPATTFSSTSLTQMNNYLSTISCLNNCEATGPIPAFNLPSVVCGLGPIKLTAVPVGNFNGFFWDMPESNLTTSNAQSVSLQYSSPGLKTVKLTAYNNFEVVSLTKQILVDNPAPSAPRIYTTDNLESPSIIRFSFGEITAPVNNFYPGYNDYSCLLTTSLIPGTTYTANAFIGAGSPSRLQVFIDYNGDGDFIDRGESIFTSADCLSLPYDFKYTVPQTVPVMNRILRLRLIAMPCDLPASDGIRIPSNANVQDYGVAFLEPERLYYVDEDGDGFGSASKAWLRTSNPPGYYTTKAGDCNDFSYFVNPDTKWIKDIDKDGYYENNPIVQCERPGAGYTLLTNQKPGDCNDSSATINPGTVWYKDADNDGYSNGDTLMQCTRPDGYKLAGELTSINDDCDDAEFATNPGAEEICYDGIDNNCDGQIDENCGGVECITPPAYRDFDGDGFGDPSVSVPTNCSTTAPTGYVFDNTDCNDRDKTIYPGAPEICGDGIDNNCDGRTDEDCTPPLPEIQTVLTASSPQSCQGTEVTFSAAVKIDFVPATSGTVTFSVNGTVVAPAVPVNELGIAAYTTSTLPSGTTEIKAEFDNAQSATPTYISSIVYQVNALPVVSFTGLISPICANGGELTLTGIPTGGAFSGPGINGTIFDPANVGAAGEIVYAYTDANGCSNSSSQSFIINPLTAITSNPANKAVMVNEPASFKVAATGTQTISYQWQVDNGSGFANLTSSSTYSGVTTETLVINAAQTYMSSWMYRCIVKGACNTATSTFASLTVNKNSTALTYTGDASEQYSDKQTLTAVLKDQASNATLANKTIRFTIGTQSVTAVTNSSGIATATLKLYQNVGSYNVVTSFAGDDTYGASTDTDPFSITKENAITDYTGPEFISVPCTTCATTTILLTASVKDTVDTNPGDIRKARVKFVNLNSLTDISGWLTPGLVSSADSTNGLVSYSWTVSIPSTSYDVYSIGVVVDNGNGAGNYGGSSQGVLSVSRAALTEFITGGGDIASTNAAGAYASDAASKVNFGFNVKYNKSNKNLQGNMNVIFRKAGRVYQIKATALSSLSINAANPCSLKSIFTSKANLIDITNPLLPISIYSGITLQVTLTDNGEPGSKDLIGITLLNGNNLVYSSYWSGKATNETLLKGGNVVVRSGVVCSSTATKAMVDEPFVTAVSIKAYPNPASGMVNFNYTLPRQSKIKLLIYNSLGQLQSKLAEGTMPAGNHLVKLNASKLSTGLYVYSLQLVDENGQPVIITGKLSIVR